MLNSLSLPRTNFRMAQVGVLRYIRKELLIFTPILRRLKFFFWLKLKKM